MLLISQAVQSNLPLGEAIRLLVGGGRENRTSRALLRFAALLDEGLEPQIAVRKAKLPRRLTALLETAFQSGDFPGYFAELTETERNRSQTFRTFINLMAYPFLLWGVMLFVVGFIAAGVVPQFETIFKDFNIDLPGLTQLILATGRMLRQPETYGILFGGIVLLFLLQRLLFPAFWYYIPVIGRILRTLASQKLLRQLLVSMKHRLPMDQALELAAGSFSQNRTFRKNCLRAAALTKEGASFSLTVSLFPLLFPQWLVPFIQTAEKNGTIPSALKHGTDILEEDQSGAVLFFVTIVVPLFTCLFLFFIPVIVIGLFLPQIKLVTALSS
ncbi:MAG: type II secretion system F family protein [Planctomycetaceae bacterium]|nr:type II secretion system F family protein [Planctomycetaceae bacterium]